MAASLSLFPVLQSNLPAETGTKELKDHPLKIRNKVIPNFPSTLRYSSYYKGFAKVVFMVDKSGQSYDFLIIETTHPLFGEVALSALQQWQVEPAIVDGRIQPSRHTVDVKFRNEGVVIEKSIDQVIQSMISPDSPAGTHYRVSELKELDRIPNFLTRISPILPAGLEPGKTSGQVKLEFYIDEKGKVRAPGVLESPNDILADAAITAVVNWQFEPPLKDGKPVVARAIQRFFFE